MYVKRNIRFSFVLGFSWRWLLFYLVYSSAIVWLSHILEHKGINIGFPFLPMSVIGIAVAFYVGFKNSQSYDRFWEARKIWGGIVNSSRTWTIQVLNFVSNLHASDKATDEELKEIHDQLVYRQLAWINSLRVHLRKPSRHTVKQSRSTIKIKKMMDDEFHKAVDCFLLKDDWAELIKSKNIPTQIVKKQSIEIKNLVDRGLIDDFRHMEMMNLLEELYTLQGKCERIKNTPFPRQYSFFSKVFMWIFILLLPLGLIGQFSEMGHEFTWLTVPFYMLIAWIFMTMELVGEYSEDPFDGSMNDVPMTALCRTIEIDLREMLGETDLPAPLEPVKDILI
ncbi:MAG: putative membrane protein [Litorivivens sp.]|jgi:putative membrane protein